MCVLYFMRKGLRTKRSSENVLYAESFGQKCKVHFKDGEVLEYSYRLNIFFKRVAGGGVWGGDGFYLVLPQKHLFTS